MPYQSRSTRRYVKKSKRNFIVTIIISIILLYATINWILPTLVNGLGFITGIFKTSERQESISEKANLAPPVLVIPFEATNTAKIDFRGYASGKKVKIFLDDELKEEVDVENDGSFKITELELNLGHNNIFGKSVDEKGEESLPSKTITIIYDNEKPSLEVSEPEDGKTFHGERKIKVSGKTEEGAKVFVNETRIIVNSDGTFSSDFSLNDGENTLTIKSIDQASNTEETTRKVTFQP